MKNRNLNADDQSLYDDLWTYYDWLLAQDQYSIDLVDKFFAVETTTDNFEARLEEFDTLLNRLAERSKHPSDFIPRLADNVFDVNHPIPEDFLKQVIAGKSEFCNIINNNKEVIFSEDWVSYFRDIDWKPVALKGIINFINKFTAEDGWSRYFVGNIGKNGASSIEYYHPMDRDKNKGKHLAALHIKGDTRHCVLLKTYGTDILGRGEPNKIEFLKIGGHIIIDPYE